MASLPDWASATRTPGGVLSVLSHGQSCNKSYNGTQIAEHLKQTVYHVLITRDGKSPIRGGTALSVDPRGYFLTAMHTIDGAPDGQIFLQKYGSTDSPLSRPISVMPMWRIENYKDLDFVVLKMADRRDVEFPSVSLHIRTDYPGKGDYLAVPAGSAVGGMVQVEPRTTETHLDQPALFAVKSRVENGHSGAMPVNAAGAAFAVIHKRGTEEADAAAQIGGFSAGVYKTLEVTGNFLTRPAVLAKLKSIPLRDKLLRIFKRVRNGTLDTYDLASLRSLIGRLTAIEALHLMDYLASGEMYKKPGYDEIRAFAMSIAASHCLWKELVVASENGAVRGQIRIDRISEEEALKKAKEQSLRDVPNLDRSTLDVETKRLESSIFAFMTYQESASIAQSALEDLQRKGSQTDKDGETRDFLLRLAVNGLRWANRKASVVVTEPLSSLVPSEKTYLSYIFADHAKAEYLLSIKMRIQPTRAIIPLVKMHHLGGNASGYSLASVIAQKYGLPDAAYNFDALAVTSLNEFDPPDEREIAMLQTGNYAAQINMVVDDLAVESPFKTQLYKRLNTFYGQAENTGLTLAQLGAETIVPLFNFEIDTNAINRFVEIRSSNRGTSWNDLSTKKDVEAILRGLSRGHPSTLGSYQIDVLLWGTADYPAKAIIEN